MEEKVEGAEQEEFNGIGGSAIASLEKYAVVAICS